MHLNTPLTFTLMAILSLVAMGCIWDADTLAMERKRFPTVQEMITGQYLRHSPAYHGWRISDRQQQLSIRPGAPALVDDLAVSLDKLGRGLEGIPLLEAVLKTHPERYETWSNLGTLKVHTGDLEGGLIALRKAVDINPDAHFGRERVQICLIEYVIDRGGLGGTLPIRERTPLEKDDKKTGTRDFVHYAYKHLPNVADKGLNEMQAYLVKGLTGMVHFGTGTHPVLYEALGDVLSSPHKPAHRYACWAYLRAAEFAPDADSKYAYQDLAEKMLANYDELDRERAYTTYTKERSKGDALLEEITRNEQHWIQVGTNPEQAFTRKYYAKDSALKSHP